MALNDDFLLLMIRQRESVIKSLVHLNSIFNVDSVKNTENVGFNEGYFDF